MFLPLFAALAAAARFYLVLPVAGAFSVRSGWRRFRAAMLEAARRPVLGYAALARAADGEGFRLSGGLEAMEGGYKLWIRGGKAGAELSVAVDMRHARLYSLPAGEADAENGRLPARTRAGTAAALSALRTGYDEASASPEPLSWRSLPALVEGTPVFVSGRLVREGGRAYLGGDAKDPATVVIYGCRENELLPLCVRQGRQPNEYWNRITPISFAIGFAWMIVVLLSFARGVLVKDIFLMCAVIAFVPLLPLLPPGLILYLGYRAAWKRARSFRASRDSILMPCAAFPPGVVETDLPGGGRYARRFRGASEPLAAEGDALLLGDDLPPSLKAGMRGFTCFGSPGGSPGSPGGSPGSPGGSPGSPIHGPDAPLSRPADPMAGLYAVPGIPEELSRRCRARARAYAFLAALALGGAAAVNAAIAFIVLRAVL